jgi:hypothetical protein
MLSGHKAGVHNPLRSERFAINGKLIVRLPSSDVAEWRKVMREQRELAPV